MTDNDWIKQLQSMMERHEEPVSNDLWQDIEARLPKHQVPRRIMPAWRRYAAAAAVALAVIGTGYLLWPDGNDSTTEKPATALTQDKIEPLPTTESFAQNDVYSPDVEIPATTTRATKAAAANAMPNAINSTGDPIVQAISTPTETKEVQEANDNEPNNQPTEQAKQTTTRPNETHVNPNAAHIVKPSRQRRPITLDLYASNNLKTENLTNEDVAMPGEISDSGEPIVLPEEIFKARHHAPLSFGVSVRIPVNSRLALNSGLVYTRLKSDFTSSLNHREQTLHYLGIPLGVTYTLWQYKRLNVYAIGGVQADFNVKATLKDTSWNDYLDISKDRMQFSGMLGPGIQLEVTHGLGFYVEPTARYYFNNGSNVENYFKDKPWNINLNAGLRLTLQ